MPEKASCQICTKNKAFKIKNTYVTLNSEKLYLVKCKKCGLIYLDPQPNQNEIEELYAEGYFKRWYSTEEKRYFSKTS